jgi:hypothetical protein
MSEIQIDPPPSEPRPRKRRGLPPAAHTQQPDDESRPPTWAERHGASLLAAVLLGLFAVVLVAQVAC